MAIVLVIATELLNTAIEATVDMISDAYHPLAKRAKDVAAGGVLVASIGALTLAYLILYPALRNALSKGLWRIAKIEDDVVAFVALMVVVIVVVIIKAFLGKGEPLRGGMPSGHAAVSFSIWSAAVYLTHSVPDNAPDLRSGPDGQLEQMVFRHSPAGRGPCRSAAGSRRDDDFFWIFS